MPTPWNPKSDYTQFFFFFGWLVVCGFILPVSICVFSWDGELGRAWLLHISKHKLKLTSIFHRFCARCRMYIVHTYIYIHYYHLSPRYTLYYWISRIFFFSLNDSFSALQEISFFFIIRFVCWFLFILFFYFFGV